MDIDRCEEECSRMRVEIVALKAELEQANIHIQKLDVSVAELIKERNNLREMLKTALNTAMKNP